MAAMWTHIKHTRDASYPKYKKNLLTFKLGDNLIEGVRYRKDTKPASCLKGLPSRKIRVYKEGFALPESGHLG